MDYSTNASDENSLELIGDTARRGQFNTHARYRDRREAKFVCGPQPKITLSIVDTDRHEIGDSGLS